MPSSYQTMIEAFAPLVYLYSSDPIRPSDVDTCLTAAALWDPTGKQVVASGGLVTDSYKALLTQTYNTQSSGSTSNTPDKKTSFSLFYQDQTSGTSVWQPPADSVLRGLPINDDNLCTAPCYAYVRVLSTAYEIVYCFFYPFNGPTGALGAFPLADVHVGDWEHITVRVKLDQTTLEGVYFARHNIGDGQWIEASKCSFAPNSKNVICYSAQNSHGTYYTSGDHANPSYIATLVGTIDYTDDTGPQWQTWSNVIDLGTIAKPSTGYEWVQYTGVWGNTDGPWVAATGPTTPSFQDWWVYGDIRVVGNLPITITTGDSNPDTGGIVGGAYYPKDQKIYFTYRGWGASHTIYCLNFNGSVWNGNQAVKVSGDELGTPTDAGLAYNENDGTLYTAYQGDSVINDDIWYSTYDGSSWAGNKSIGGSPETNGSPALAFCPINNRLYMVYRGETVSIYQASLDSSGKRHGNKQISISDNTSYSTPQTDGTPGLAYYPEASKLYMAYTRSKTNDLYLVAFDGNNWTGNTKITASDDNGNPTTPQCNSSPALAYFNGKLHMIYRGLSYGLYHSIFDGTEWKGNFELGIYGTALKTDTAPGLAVLGNKLYMLFPGYGLEGQMYWAYIFE